MSNLVEITMQDVETAIKILNEFLRRSREAQMTIKRLEVTTIGGGRMPTSLQDFMNLAWQSKQPKPEPTTGPSEEEPVTEEELKRMREIKEKMKAHR